MNKIVRVAVISHQQLREHFSYLKNFDATIAFFRREKLLPPSIRRGNISSLKRGNMGVHPGIVIEFIEKVFGLRKQGKSYKEIKEELKEDILNVKSWYTRKDISLNDPRFRPDALLDTYNEVLMVMERYYGWPENSIFRNFYKSIPAELIKLRNLYFNTVIELSIKDKSEKYTELIKKREEYGKKLDACFDTVYFIIRQYEKLRKGGNKLVDVTLNHNKL
jgi:hypothetical protein